jgi:hypothetical protein
MIDNVERAFPAEGLAVTQPGMTLRDYFAAQAIRGGADALCDQLDPLNEDTTEADAAEHAKRHAHAAYLLADALLAERNKQ